MDRYPSRHPWRPVERWYRTLIMFAGSIVYGIVFLFWVGPEALALPLVMLIIVLLWPVPAGWRDHLPRLAAVADRVQRR
ncbi:hypothetical protein [Ornithinimicrobium cerasi]|uniref:hypothetical protein n=1 Tax=Ornithinimicrobium cerasi TaxID=2248773 RepID=UPI00137A722B|nr:hypothetical protein [Ornithinimicrobium cerasi]